MAGKNWEQNPDLYKGIYFQKENTKRTFFVEANARAHVDVYLFKSFVKIREYWSTLPYP